MLLVLPFSLAENAYYLVTEEHPLSRQFPGGLHPRVAGKVHRTTRQPTLDDDALQKELPVVPVGHGDGAGLAKV